MLSANILMEICLLLNFDWNLLIPMYFGKRFFSSDACIDTLSDAAKPQVLHVVIMLLVANTP